MSSPPDTVLVTIEVDRAEMARRGRIGGNVAAAKRDNAAVMTRARQAFDARFASEDERRAHFAELGRRSGEARRQHRDADAAEGGAT